MLNNLFSGFEEIAFYTKKFDVTVLLGIILLVFITYILRSKKNRNLPPGPIGLPLFGYYFFLKNNPVKTLTELAKKYGNVFGLHVGPQYAVFLNDWEAVKDGLGQKSALGRPDIFKDVPHKFGVAGVNGAEWVQVRRLMSKVLKDGLHRNKWENLVENELNDVVEHIRRYDGKPIEVRAFLGAPFANNLVSLILGKRLGASHPISIMVWKAVDFIIECLPVFRMINFSQPLNTFMTILGIEEKSPLEATTKDMFKYVADTVDSNRHKNKSERGDSFISRFQDEIDNHKLEETYITEGNLTGTVIGLIIGGSETTRTSMIWAIVAMVEHPDKQKKVQEELDAVIGKEGSVRWSERSKVPYTLACLLEAMRWRTVMPVPVLRSAMEDTEIQGYHIPKGTYVITNNWMLHNDPKYWKNPEQFIPERFLLEDGRKVNLAPDSYNPFSYGKRNCPGKLLALMNMLQYFSTLMHKFKLEPKEGDKLKYEEILYLSFQARNVEIRFIPR